MQIISTSIRPAFTLLLMMCVTSVVFADDAFRDMQGNITSMDAQKEAGKWTIVMIWAADCHVCNKEAGQYSEFHVAHSDEDAKIMGLSIDGQQGHADAEAFIDRNGVIFPTLIADLNTVARWYQRETGESFRATPTFVVFGPGGEVKAAQAGAVPPEVIEKFMASNS